MNAATAPTVVLTLVMPLEIEDALIETLLEYPDLAPGFTTVKVEGHGQRVTFTDTAEHVRGRAAYSRVQLVVPQDAAESLLAILRQHFATGRVFYWMIPTLASGRLA